MGWIARCQAGSSSSRAFEDAEECETGGTSQLEVNIISAQDVQRASYVGQMRAYAVAWIKQDHKLRTQMVDCSDLHPVWNARLHFYISDALFRQEKGTHSALTIELYCQGRVRDILLGSVRVLLSTLFRKGKGYHSAQSLSLQIRRPSGCPQGILNIGSLILDLDASLMKVPPLLTSPYLLEDDEQKLGKFAPLREFQEICRRSFSVSRDDVLMKEKLCSDKFALDDNSLKKYACFDLIEAVSEDENEEDLAIDAIYKKLKALSKCNLADDDDAQNEITEQVLTKSGDGGDDGDTQTGRTGHGSTKPIPHIKQDEADDGGNTQDGRTGCGPTKPIAHIKQSEGSADDSSDAQDGRTGHGHVAPTKSIVHIKQNEVFMERTSGKGCNGQLSFPTDMKAAMESSQKLEGKHFEKKGNQLVVAKLNNEAMQKESNEFAWLYRDALDQSRDKSVSKKQGEDDVFKINKMGDSVVFVWKDLPLHKKKELFCDELIGKDDASCRKPPSTLSIWAKRASWAFKKNATKIHRSPSDK